MADLKALADAVIRGDQATAVKVTKAALQEKTAPKKILDEGLIAGMDVVGARFKNNEIYIPEVLIAARAMKMAMEVLEPELAKAGVKPIGKFLIGTVQGDLHDIGKNLVAMMLKGAGLRGDRPGRRRLARTSSRRRPRPRASNLIGMSALLTTTMPGMEKTIKALKQAGVKAKVMVGGAPVTQELRRQDRRRRLRPRRRLGGRHGQKLVA